MAESDETYIVTSEEDAFSLLEKALAGNIPDAATMRIDFRGWPRLDVHLPATPVDASISPTMMEAFIELQTAIYRSYLLLNSETGDLRSLTKAEKDHLEFRVRVSGGSSDYKAELAKALDNIASSMVAKMSSTELMICIIGVAVIVGGVVAWKAWLSARTEQRKAELDKEDKRAMLDAQRDLLAHNARQSELLVSAIARQPVLGDVEASAEAARYQMVKAIADERGGTLQGVPLDAEFASEVVSQKRQQGTPATFTGVYRVSKVDTTVPDGFRVTLSDLATGREVSASLQDALISEDHRVAIREAEWSKRPISVRMSARLLRNRYVDAVVLHVESLPTPASVPPGT